MGLNKGSSVPEDRRVIISTLWIVVLFNMILADVVGFMNPGALDTGVIRESL